MITEKKDNIKMITEKNDNNKINNCLIEKYVYSYMYGDGLNRNPPMSTNVIGGFCAFTYGASTNRRSGYMAPPSDNGGEGAVVA